MLDLLVKNAALPQNDGTADIAVQDKRIAQIAPNIEAEAARVIDAAGHLVTPPFVDPHFHLDAALSLGKPRMNESGTLLEGIQIWGELKPTLTPEAIKSRAMELLTWSIARGTLAVRTHVDVTDPSLMAVDVLLEVREEMKDYVDIQLVAFPQDGVLRTEGGMEMMKRALDKGVDVVGGIPHFERTMDEGAKSVKWLCELAAARGLLVDMHCDETDDPASRHVETLAYETNRLGLHARVTGSHLTSMHSMDNYYVSKLLPLMAEAELHAVCNPLINIHLMGRHDTYPKRRGLTRVPELLDAGVNVAFGHDCVMDPWYPMGTHDMLDCAHMGAHCLQMMGAAGVRRCFEAVTHGGARAMHLPDYGLAEGAYADFVVLRARDEVDAVRLRPERLHVVRRGTVVAETPPAAATVRLAGGATTVDFIPKGE